MQIHIMNVIKFITKQNGGGIFLGDFSKAILKINNIAYQLEKVFTKLEKIDIVHNLKQIPKLTLKAVTTNESIYI